MVIFLYVEYKLLNLYGSKSAKPPADLLTKNLTIKTPKHILFNALKRLFNQMCLLYLNSGVLI